MRFLALGDSYTIGESVTESERWPVQLAKRLQEHSFPLDELVVVARTGWTTAELQAAIEQAELTGAFHLVSLLIGVNNQYRGMDYDGYRHEFKSLLTEVYDFAQRDPNRVVVLSIPDWGVTPFADGRDRDQIANDIARFNAINYEESEQMGVHYVDVTPVSRLAADNKALIAADGLHPSGKMYSLWTDLVFPIAHSVLRNL